MRGTKPQRTDDVNRNFPSYHQTYKRTRPVSTTFGFHPYFAPFIQYMYISLSFRLDSRQVAFTDDGFNWRQSFYSME